MSEMDEVWWDSGGWEPPKDPNETTLRCFTDADLAAHDAQVRAEALAPIEALADEWDRAEQLDPIAYTGADCAEMLRARDGGDAVLASDWLAAHDAQVRAEALAPIEALDDYVCGALMAAKHGSYDGRSVESHLERLLDKVRAAMEAKG